MGSSAAHRVHLFPHHFCALKTTVLGYGRLFSRSSCALFPDHFLRTEDDRTVACVTVGPSAAHRVRGVGRTMPSPTATTQDGPAAAAAAAAMRSSSGLDVDMFEALSQERVQLCLTLEQGADRISVYLGVCAEAWPVGMVPGFCTVQVRSSCGSVVVWGIIVLGGYRM